MLLFLVCTNPRYPSRPVPAKGGRVRIHPGARLADSTESRASLTTLAAYLWSRHWLALFHAGGPFPPLEYLQARTNGMDKRVWMKGKACLGEPTFFEDLETGIPLKGRDVCMACATRIPPTSLVQTCLPVNLAGSARRITHSAARTTSSCTSYVRVCAALLPHTDTA